MSFYFSLYQIIEGVERLIHDIQHLTSRAHRISPRDARSNRELLEQCETKLSEVRNILTNKSHISKVTLRKASFLFQILEVNYRRVIHLAGAPSLPGAESLKDILPLLGVARKHYLTILENLDGLTGIPVSVALKADDGPPPSDLSSLIRREAEYQAEALKLLDKAVEVLGEEEGLSDKLALMRKELIDLKRPMKMLLSEPAIREIAIPQVAFS